MASINLLKKLELRNAKAMGDAKMGLNYSMGELQILFSYVLDGTMTPADMKKFIEEKIAN
jgi:hypothetical protein